MFMNTFCHFLCALWMSHAHMHTRTILLQIQVFLIGICDSHFPAAEILIILILISGNFLLNVLRVHSDVNMNLRKLKRLLK